MKKLLIILGVVLVATAMITSCGDPGEEGAIWTVTFDPNDGDPITPQKVENGNSATEPKPTDYFKAYTPTTAGFYPASLQVTEWQKADGKKFDFAKEKITSDITLKAVWGNPTALNPTGSGSAVEKAIGYAKGSNGSPAAGKFILALGENITATLTELINVSYANLTIIGIGTERTITFTGTGAYITVGADTDNSTIGLTLGNNIKLIGNGTSVSNANTNALVVVKNRAVLTISGATITQNRNKTATAAAGWGCAGVIVDKGELRMTSGSITDNTNHNTDINTYKNTAAGVYAQNGAKLTLSGGSIKNNLNEGGTDDVFVTADSTVTVGGNIEVGSLCLVITGSNNSKVAVNPGYNGNIVIDLRGEINTWVGKEIVTGGSPADFNTTKIKLGKFVISPNVLISLYEIGADGKVKAK